MFPVWLKFRGGKGVATGFGSFLMVAPKTILVAVAIFLALVAAFRYVSLGSMIAVASASLGRLGTRGRCGQRPGMLLFMAAASIFIIAKHHDNIRRLLAGTENRFQWRRG